MTDKQPSFDPQWQETYESSLTTPADAVAKLRPGQRVFIGTGCAEPLELVRALTNRATELADTEILHLLTFGEAPYAHKELAQYFRVNSFFIAENVRDIIQEGLGDYTPILLSDIPRLFQLRAVAARCRADPSDPARRRRHVQLGRVRGHRQERRGERLAGHRPGQPATCRARSATASSTSTTWTSLVPVGRAAARGSVRRRRPR